MICKCLFLSSQCHSVLSVDSFCNQHSRDNLNLWVDMRILNYRLILFFLLTLVSCQSTNELKSNDNNKKQKKMIMKVTTEPSIKVKK